MLFIYHVSRSWQPCGHLLGKGYPLGSLVCVVFVCFCHFPIWLPESGVVLDCITIQYSTKFIYIVGDIKQYNISYE